MLVFISCLLLVFVASIANFLFTLKALNIAALIGVRTGAVTRQWSKAEEIDDEGWPLAWARWMRAVLRGDAWLPRTPAP